MTAEELRREFISDDDAISYMAHRAVIKRLNADGTRALGHEVAADDMDRDAAVLELAVALLRKPTKT